MILTGDCRELLATMDAGSARCCVTSPPYFGLRDYGHDGQIGLEQTPDAYVAEFVAVFREVRRVLADDGTLWLNLGDSYAANRSYQVTDTKHVDVGNNGAMSVPDGLKPKDLLGIPWRVAFALQTDGWYLRSDIIWAKPNPMPESVRDRPTKSHEYLFLLSKSERYYYDADAIAEPSLWPEMTHQSTRIPAAAATAFHGSPPTNFGRCGTTETGTRNKRDVWTVTTEPFPGAHFAVMPTALVEPCVLAGRAEGDTILDPFAGSGTVGVVAHRHRREFVGIELNAEYVALAARRMGEVEVSLL